METKGFKAPRPPGRLPDDKSPSVRQKLAFSGVIKHKVTESDVVSTFKPQSCTERPDSHQGYSSWNYVPPIQQLLQNPYFSLHGVTPKVLIPYKTSPGQTPRKLEIERRRREYSQLDLEQLLVEKGIDSETLIPRQVKNSHEDVTTSYSPGSPFLPLELFDNEDFDSRTPEDWLALGYAEGSPDQKPIPAKAFLPKDETPDDLRGPHLEYSWHLVGVLDYCKEKFQYLVQKVYQNNRETHEEGNPIVNKKHKKKIITLVEGSMHWVPRIRLLFCAEDPHVFAERISFALNTRKDTEVQILYSMSVYSMPIWEGMPSLSTDSLQLIKRLALSAPDPSMKKLEGCMTDLEMEVKLEYDHVMNSMIFDKVVQNNQREFSHITLPQKVPGYVPQKGCVAVPHFPYKENRNAFAFHFLLKIPEVIRVLSELQSECSKVANMRLFKVTSTRPLQLNEYELIQSHSHTQLKLYLQERWTVTISSNILSALCVLDKGPFNVNEHSFSIYKNSRLYKLMNVVLFNMQDSLRYLVQDSLISLTEYLLEACDSVLMCPQNLVWGNDLISSSYKSKRNPLFLVDLVLDHTGVHYSSSVEDFVSSVMKMFDEGILATSEVPKLDKFVLKNMFIYSRQLLESVGLWEPKVNELREKIRSALVQAAIPLRAYAAEYEKYSELHNLDIEAFLRSHSAEQTSQEVKSEVEQHLIETERLEHSLPSSIVIGPFLVRVEGVRQSLINKRKALATALLGHLALKLRKQTDDACEECNNISRKLSEKPNSIEELTEKRDWMKQIPKQLKTYRKRLGKTLSDYEVIEAMRYCLSDEDENKKWTAVGWPQKIFCQMRTVTIQHEEDEERFRKHQLDDDKKFEEQLDLLQNAIAWFEEHLNIDHTHEIANKVSLTSKQLQEYQRMAQTYNTKQHLLGLPVLKYKHLQKVLKDFQPFKDLWIATSDWLRWKEYCLNDPLSSVDPEQLMCKMTDAHKMMNKCIKQFSDMPDVQMVATVVLKKIEEFQPCVLLFQCLRDPMMRNRHWETFSEQIHKTVRPKGNLKLTHYMELGLQNHVDDLTQLAKVARKEYAIEQALEKMEQEWSTVYFDLLPCKETKTYILKSPDEVFQMLDHHAVVIQSLSISPFKKPFENQVDTWERKLRMTRAVLEEWLMCQHFWLYLEPIFGSDDASQHLPVEVKNYQIMELQWKNIMRSDFENQKVIELCTDTHLQRIIKHCHMLSEKIKKGLSVYLMKKRGSFPRLYFLSDNELLEILSKAKNPTAVQPYLSKCFENIAQLNFQTDLQITHVCSREGEEVELFLPVCPTGNVEDWLRDVEISIRATLREDIDRLLKVYPDVSELTFQCFLFFFNYCVYCFNNIKIFVSPFTPQMPRADWVLSWPGQVVIAGCQVFWTAEVSEALEQGDLANRLYPQLQTQLGDLVQLTKGQLSKMQQAVLSALIVIEIHAKDVVSKLVEQEVSSINDFEWISQIRYYWTKGDMYVRAVDTEFMYGYEYLGNSKRLVITPLTHRCYLTMMAALHLKLGGALVGPTGTGKTETVKDLGKALAIQTVVFNCTGQLDFVAVNKLLQGLAISGAWVCCKDVNHIDVEVLSVMTQQVFTIQNALHQNAERFVFEGMEIPLAPSCAVFFTMNPAYTGYMEMPGNLKVLFRPVAMAVPDYAMIAEISLYSFGFRDAKVLSKKITLTFRLSSEQLSSQDHYDFGMRAVKAVISVAGTKKRENPDMNEERICLQAIRDISEPKFLQDDLKLFSGILSDLFPRTELEPFNYAILEESLRNTCTAKNLKDVDGFINKCIQLYETTQVRHGLMLVGPPGSGKTKCYETLGAAITALEGQPAARGGLYQAVQMYVLNPKSVTVGQLYGEYDWLTHKWTDGIFPALLRRGAASMDTKKQWYMLDGPVDAMWIDNMNTVLDDNKKLCLSSGEVINLTDVMTVMFEVQDLAGASPATVSRCGMVYLEPSILELTFITECWLKQIPEVLKLYMEQLNYLFSTFLQDSITFVRTSVKESITSLDINLICSLLKLMDCFFSPFNTKEGEMPPPQTKLEHLKELIEPWFFFSLVWSVGATGDVAGRQCFSAWLKNKMAEERITLCFPEEGLVYDYRLDDAGVNNSEDQENQEERKVQWVSWMENTKSVVITPETHYADIFVPTADTVSVSFLLDMLLTNKKPVLCIGPTGTGKTTTMSDKLLKNMPAEYITHVFVFSALTSANQTQDYIDSKLIRRWKGVLGPPVRKHFIFFIDELNLPMLQTFGALPPFELLRQWMDYGGWYNRKQIGTFNRLEDINFACAMGTPSGTQNNIAQRFTRHFNILSFTEMDNVSKKQIFSAILDSWIGPESAINPLIESLVDATIRVYTAIVSQLLPAPAKPHYTFNLRHLSKVFQGVRMAEASMIKDKLELLQLWYHESCRVFQDCLVCAEDRDWFNKLLKDCIQEFDCCYEEVVPCHPVLFGDFMIPLADHKIYTLIEDKKKLVQVMENYMEDYNEHSGTKMKLVLFMDAIEHVCRISRILRQPRGNALLLGVGGSGRQSLTKLATYISEYECFPIELAKNYSQSEWREDIKNLILKAGLQNQQITFLIVDTQIKCETYLEDICSILNCGDVPNLYGADEKEHILTAMKPVVQDQGQKPTIKNLMAAYIRRVRNNIHIVLCMSPVSKMFRTQLRLFPSLVKCCTIDWFSIWPEEALQAVATSFLNELPELDVSPTTMKGLTLMCVKIHQTVSRKSEQYLAELSRNFYVTPKSYLDLLKIFSDLTGCKKQELCSSSWHIKTGLDKLRSTTEDECKLQEELKIKKPLLKEAARDAEVNMETIKLIGGLADEEERWKKTVQHLDNMVHNLAGDMLLCAGYVVYLGPFTEEYRVAIAEEWLHCFKTLCIPHSDEPSLLNTLGDPIKIRSWQISGLPKDNFSMENGVIAHYSLRWALFIDPQGQANKWIKNMERDSGLEVMKLSDQDFFHRLKNAIRFGKPCLLEDVGEELDPALEPVLLQQTFKQHNNTVLTLGDSVIPYQEDFKMYITTKMSNPHYSLEISTKVTLINFTLSPSGLEELLLRQLLTEEHPQLEKKKNQLIISKATMKQELKEVEDGILLHLSSTEGNLVDNKEFIQVLETSKIKAGELKAKMMETEKTERDINATFLEYAPVAVRSQILFFCVSDMSKIDPMYQHSLEWFLDIFTAAVANSEAAETVKERVSNINEFFTFSLYSRVCRCLFERHRLMFAFLLCARIMMNENKIDMMEWHYLLSGCMPVQELANPAENWLSDRAWQDILGLSTLENFSNLAESFTEHMHVFKNIFDSSDPHREPLPGEWDTRLDSFQKLLILRCLRPDCLIQGLQDFVSVQLGQRFIEPQTSDLSVIFKESSRVTPLILVLSPGSDPAADLYNFAKSMQFSKKMSVLSLGQGQGPLAEAMMQTAMEGGQWVFFQNCHLAPSWMPTLERLINSIDPVKNGFKITIEPPMSIKASLQKTYLSLTNDFFSSSTKTGNLKSLLLPLCLFHGIALQRRKFGPLGFNIPYEFTDNDLNVCISQLKMFLDKYQDIPYKVLKYTVGEINYGGHVTDDWDRRCLLTVLEDLFCPAVLSADRVYSSSGVCRKIDSNLDIKGYLAYIHGLPIKDPPEIFGLHDNATISFAQNETFSLLDAVVCLQPRASSVESKSLEETLEEIVAGISEKVPQPFNVQKVTEKYPVLYEESMNTVLIHEVIRYNKLLVVISQSLGDVVQALKGSLVMSSELELMANSLLHNMVPDVWKAKAYPSLKPLASWVSDLLQRINFLQRWIFNGPPPVFWISGFFFPQSFLTGTLQNYARCSGTSIDTVGFDFKVKAKSVSEITEIPSTGCYIHGLFLEGARWDDKAGRLTESRPKELYTQMAVIWLIPKPNRKRPHSGVYLCPVYKTLRRAGTLTATGHSTNYVFAVELPTDHSQKHWIRRGAALICALDS
ncbi:dynein heavy chain 1, axonemal isoform X2 [Melanotaenia boesemani]|uniref:dynein heavy chain 1, axonemal isoform X2 n=1 Tax=Melanotaenia boesemani TaxID=1250792 RepID=UPI001C04AA5F|nr:dynein heavy chain 1, axonemal isoform X2 [Melanotaenia boesemani]